jgi:predicted amidophosphoribosyltransferase
MDDEQQRHQSEQCLVESSLLKLQEAFHQFVHECHECQREIALHWQVCAHCGARLATHCPGCGPRSHRSARRPAHGAGWHSRRSSRETSS